MTKLLAIPVAAVLAAGCAATPNLRPLPSDHPASANAASTPLPLPSDALNSSDPISNPAAGASTDGMSGMDMGGMKKQATPAGGDHVGH